MNSKALLIYFIVFLTAAGMITGCSAAKNSTWSSDPNQSTADRPTAFTLAGRYGPSIHSIQGEAHISPLAGQSVRDVHGVVTAVTANGFYLQDPNPDQNQKTSEGIFIFTDKTPEVIKGDEILVSGIVDEFFPGGTQTGNLSITEIMNPSIKKISEGKPLPIPVVIGRGGRVPPNQVIDRQNNIFNPEIEGLDFFESMESMLVQVNRAVVVGPTNNYQETAVLADDGQDAGLRTPRGGIVIRPDDYNPERIIVDDLFTDLPDFNVGDTFKSSLVGVVDYSFGNYKLQVISRPAFQSGGLQKEIAPDPKPGEFSIASLNVQNLDPGDGKTRFDNYARLLITSLKSPDIIALDEIQDNNGPAADQLTDASLTYRLLIEAIKALGGPEYEYREIAPEPDQDGGEPGGNVRVGFLFRSDRGLQFRDRGRASKFEAAGIIMGTAGPILTLSPGRIDPGNPAFNDSRKPLVAEFFYQGHTLFLIGLHLNSKSGDSPLFGRIQPPVLSSEKQRLQQVEVIQAFVSKILAKDPNANILVLGDLNDFQFSKPVRILSGGGMKNLVFSLPENLHYSYIYDGNSQVLDHMIVSDSLAKIMSYFAIVHVNAEFAASERLSDHDPILARFLFQSN